MIFGSLLQIYKQHDLLLITKECNPTKIQNGKTEQDANPRHGLKFSIHNLLITFV